MASIMNLSVSEAMSSDYGTVNYNTPVHVVLDLMLQNQWDEVLVVDDEGKERGLVTKEHLTRKMAEGVEEDTFVREICVREILTINYDEQLTIARDFMRRHKIGRLPVTNEAGEIIGILTARDICNGFSGKLEALGNHLYSVIENIVEAVQVIDCDGKVSLWNRQAEKLFGIEAREIVGRKLEDFFPDDLLLEVINTGKSYNYVPAELKRGTYVVRNAVPVFNPDKKLVGAVCTTQDISYYYNLMGQLDKANSKVRNLKRTIAVKDEINEEAFFTVNFRTRLVLEQAKKVAKTDATVLIQGESGTGKELMAHVIYENSKRAEKPFIEINCCAIPETLFESEMFGYESGAFTGAQKYGKVGKFELAQGGTIFLDEIGELPLEMQGKLLRVLQEKRFYRVGGTVPINCDVRVIAATNQNLYNLVQEGKFRSDLYYRLNVVNLTIPPLRERKDDILGLTRRFVKELAASYNRSIEGIDDEFIEILINYSWPGNVRQLHNVLERIIILTEGNYISKHSLDEVGVLHILMGDTSNEPVESSSFDTLTPEKITDPTDSTTLDDIILQQERELIIKALEKCKNNKVQAAKMLGIPRSTLYYKLKTLNLV